MYNIYTVTNRKIENDLSWYLTYLVNDAIDYCTLHL